VHVQKLFFTYYQKKVVKVISILSFLANQQIHAILDYQQHITKILNGLIKASTWDEPWLVEIF
jgi:hypothetical protein